MFGKVQRIERYKAVIGGYETIIRDAEALREELASQIPFDEEDSLQLNYFLSGLKPAYFQSSLFSFN